MLGLLDSRRAGRPFFAFAIWLSLLAPAQAARILAKQDRPLFRRAMMPLFSMGMDSPEHSIYALIKEKLKSIQEPWPYWAARKNRGFAAPICSIGSFSWCSCLSFRLGQPEEIVTLASITGEGTRPK